MNTRRQYPMVALVAALGTGAVAACGEEPAPGFEVVETAVLGDALPGTNAAEFAEAKEAFNASENAVDGLGPIFNERGCGTCHHNGAIGGAGQQVESLFGRLVNGTFDTMAS